MKRCAQCQATAKYTCRQCESALYCSFECQSDAWPQHSSVCIGEAVDIDELEDARVEQVERETGETASWQDVMYFIINDSKFRVDYLEEVARDSDKFVILPTFELNATMKDWNAMRRAEGLPASRRRVATSDPTELARFFTETLERAGGAPRDGFIIMGYRQRITDSYEDSVHWNVIIVSVSERTAYLFDPGVGLWGDLYLERGLQEAMSDKRVTAALGGPVSVAALVPGCRIQQPKRASRGKKVERDNLCQSWTLYVAYRVIKDGGSIERVTQKLQERERSTPQGELLSWLIDKFLIAKARNSDAYETALSDDTLPWDTIIPVFGE